MDNITRSFFQMENIEIRDADNKRAIAGYAAVFEKFSVPMFDFKEKIRAGAFKNSLEKNNVRALWNHNSDLVLGSIKAGTLKLNEDEKGLHFELDLPDTQSGRDTFTTIKRGDVDGMSFGFRVLKQEWDESNPKNIIRTLIEIDLIEISPTAFPAYPSTNVKARTIEDDYHEFQDLKKNTDQSKNIRALAQMKRFITIYLKEIPYVETHT
jgi:HK97 family phage prohead protease